jgi:oligopeptide transport system substrate-binding protein
MAVANGNAETLRRGLGAEPDSLDIHQAQGLPALQVLRDIGEGLLTHNAQGELVPGFAQSWEADEQGRIYRFHLREDARWSNGDPLVADDFVRGWQLALAPDSMARTAALMAPLKNATGVMAGYDDPASLGVHAESARILVVELEEAAPWFLEILAHPVSFPVHPQGSMPVAERPVSGAYRVADLKPNAWVRLSKNAYHYDAANVRVEAIEYLPVEDPGTELSRYRAGELDITETIPPGRHDWLAENFGEELRITPYLGSFWLGINMGKAPLGESVELRRALYLAINREMLVTKVLGAGELPGWSVVPPGLGGYPAGEGVVAGMSQAEREAEARDLYQRAGFGPERPLRVEIRFNTSTQHRRMAVAVSAMWKQVLGVASELVHEEWKVFVNNRRMGLLTEVFRGGWIADYADPASFLDLFRAGDPLNTSFYANAQYDQLLDQAAGRTGSQRMALLRQAETLLMRDMPVIPLYYYVSRHLVKPRVRGYQDNVRDVHLSRYLAIDTEME